MITVYGRADSSNVQAVMWCIGELGLEHQRENFGHRFGGTSTEAYRAMNPNGLVPVLRDGDNSAIFESAAILRYLASAYGSNTFWPTDPVARAQVDKWAEWAKTTLGPRFTVPIFWATVRTAPSQQNPTKIADAVAAFNEKLLLVEAQLLKHPFLAGAEFTLADIQLGYLLYRYYQMPISHADLPALHKYYAALEQRPAYKTHVMVSYDALRVSD